MGTTQIRRPMAGMGVLVAIAFLLSCLTLSPAHAVGAPARVQSENAQLIADLFDEHNRQRREHRLPALVFSPTISLRVTQPFTNTMAAADNGTIWHNDADVIRRGGSNWAENVIGGFRGETAADLVGRWMDSSGHRTNLLNRNYTTIAIGFAYADDSDWLFATTNFYADPKDAGPTYRTGAEWLASRTAPKSNVNVYLTPGTHNVNGRLWRTVCEKYSQTKRCRTEIWASQTQRDGGRYVTRNGWMFNNLTYAPSPRRLWAGNPLAANGKVGGSVTWTSGGRPWRTECDTAATGRNGCRTYTRTTVVVAVGSGHRSEDRWIFNNMVVFD